MTRNAVTVVSLLGSLILSPAAIAEPAGRLIELREGQAANRLLATRSPCATCADRIPVLDVGRPPLPGEEGSGVQSCSVIQTAADWDAYCAGNVIPECPLLGDPFFDQHTVIAVAIDTVTPRPCEGSADPVWKLECVQTASPATTVRVVEERPFGLCRCSAMPQQPQRLFLASAVPKTSTAGCRVCDEERRIGCLR